MPRLVWASQFRGSVGCLVSVLGVVVLVLVFVVLMVGFVVVLLGFVALVLGFVVLVLRFKKTTMGANCSMGRSWAAQRRRAQAR